MIYSVANWTEFNFVCITAIWWIKFSRKSDPMSHKDVAVIVLSLP